MDKIKSIVDYIKLIFLYEDNTLNLVGKITVTLVVLIATHLVVKYTQKAFSKFLDKRDGKTVSKLIDSKKRDTITSILSNILKYFIYFIALLIILRIFGVSTKYLAGTAGIGGVALGFGAQSIVRDIISGLFIMLENQFEIGDNIVINNIISGNVVEFGIKTTKIQGFDGSINIISNGNINMVQNKSRGNQRAYVEIVISNQTPISEIESIIEEISKKFSKNKEVTVKPFLLGVIDSSLGGEMKIAIVAWTKPGKEVSIGIQIRELFFKEAAKRNIDLEEI